MQKRNYSSYYDTRITSLVNELVLKVDEAQRCQEVLGRLNCYKADEKIPVDVIDFIGNYAPIQIVSKEGLITKGVDILKSALNALMKAIEWIIQKLKEIFKYCFDAEYRACKETLDIQRRMLVLSANATACNKFINSNCDVIKKADLDAIITKTQQLTELISNAAKMSDQSYVEVLLREFGASAGVIRSGSNALIDNVPSPAPARNTTYMAAGWTIDGISGTIVQYLACLRGIESLKNVQKDVDAAAKDLKKRAEQAALNGATSGDVNALQKEAATKIAMTTLMGYAIAISSRRSENILQFINSLYTELHKCAK